MLISILGIIVTIGFDLFWLHAIVIGIRDGISRQRIRIRSTDDHGSTAAERYPLGRNVVKRCDALFL